MRALVLSDWWKLTLSEVPDPELPDDGVLLEIIATGICGSDIHGFTGENRRRHPGQVMGHETVARIVGLGPAVPPQTGLRVGDAVTVNPVISCGSCRQCRAGREQACPNKVVIGVAPSVSSAFAERMAVPAANVVRLPDGMPVEHGALVEPLAVGYHALRRGGCAEGDAVLVIGGGPIGQSCVLAALRLGAQRVAVSEPDAHRRELNERIGAVTVDPTTSDAIAEEVSAALGAEPTLVVDAVGSSRSLTTAFACAPLGGTVVLVGMATPELDVGAFEVSTKERSLVGSFCYNAAEFRETVEWAATVSDTLVHLIEGRTDLEGAPAGFEALARGENPASKVLVFPNAAASAEVLGPGR